MQFLSDYISHTCWALYKNDNDSEEIVYSFVTFRACPVASTFPQTLTRHMKLHRSPSIPGRQRIGYRWCRSRAELVMKMTNKKMTSHKTLNMFLAKKLLKICFFIIFVIWLSLCITNIHSRLENVNTSLNIVTESLIPFKQALCMNYTDNTLYSING